MKSVQTLNLKNTRKVMTLSNAKGFTLIELLVVIGILAVLLAIVLIAINPARQFAQANNTKRNGDVIAILNAIHQYAADNKGLLPPGMPLAGAAAVDVANTGADICASIVTRYLAALPSDPQAANGGNNITACGAAYDTDYSVSVSATDNRITITAPTAQLGATIQATR